MLLALDPGINSPGVALFRAGTLVAADKISGTAYKAFEDGQRWLEVAKSIVTFAQLASPDERITTVIFEKVQFYQRKQGGSKGDPNKLLGVAGVAANVTGILSTYGPIVVLSPTPAEWVGQIPKTCSTCGENKKKCPVCKGSAWKTTRGRRIRSRLTEAEIALVPDQNDAIDAVGVGLYAEQRFTPRSVLSNGRDGK